MVNGFICEINIWWKIESKMLINGWCFYVLLNNELFSYYVYDYFCEYFVVNLEVYFVFVSGM